MLNNLLNSSIPAFPLSILPSTCPYADWVSVFELANGQGLLVAGFNENKQEWQGIAISKEHVYGVIDALQKYISLPQEPSYNDSELISLEEN